MTCTNGTSDKQGVVKEKRDEVGVLREREDQEHQEGAERRVLRNCLCTQPKSRRNKESFH